MACESQPGPAGQPFRAGAALADAARLYVAHWRLFLALGALSVLNSQLGAAVVSASRGWPLLLLREPYLALSMIVSLWISAALLIAASGAIRQQGPGVGACIAGVRGRFWKYAVTMMLWAFIFCIGIALLVIPGVYWGVILWLAPVSAALEGKGWRSAMRRSRQLIRGAFWPVFAAWFVLLVLGASVWLGPRYLPTDSPIWGAALRGAIGLFLTPYALIVAALVFHRLKELSGPEEAPGPEQEKIGCRSGCLAAVGLYIVGVALIIVWYFVLRDTVVMEFFRASISHEVRLDEGVHLPRPHGWQTRRVQDAPSVYVLSPSQYGIVRRRMLWSVALADVESEATPGDERFAREVDRLAQERLPTVGREAHYAGVSVQSLDIHGRAWVEYRLKASPADDREAYKTHLYTVHRGTVIVLTYISKFRTSREQEADSKLEREREELHRIVGTLQFPQGGG